MRIHSVVIFAGGLLIGGVSGFFGAKKMYREKYKKEAFERSEERIKEMAEYWGVNDEYTGRNRGEDIKDYEEYPVPSKDEREAMKEIRKNTTKSHTDYKSYYEAKQESDEYLTEGVDPAEEESPEEDIINHHNDHRNDPPELIEETDLGDVPSYVEEVTLLYDTETGVLTYEDDTEIHTPMELLFGDIFDEIIHEIDNGDYPSSDSVYIWNHSQDTLYCIQLL